MFSVLVILYVTVTEIPDINSLRKKDLFWLTVSESSVHGCLAPCIRAEHHGGRSVWWSCFLWQTGSRKWQEEARIRYAFQRHMPSYLLSPTRPYLLEFPEPPKIVPW
jgi:hypothetical protein